MISFFKSSNASIIAVESITELSAGCITKLEWLLEGKKTVESSLKGPFIGPRREMITPWSTNAVEITQNMAIDAIVRIERFEPQENENHDSMLKAVWEELNQNIYLVDTKAESIKKIDDIESYNKSEGLALNELEIEYLKKLSDKMGRSLTDSEVFGFSQVNSEHCRHKIFNGQFIIDNETKDKSLFALIKKTTTTNPGKTVSAYKDNVAFIEGPSVEQFSPESKDQPSYFEVKSIDSILSIKAETHNFPTTVEPFNGAATGAGGEIRDRLAGGKASVPLAGTAVYMTPYSRLDESRSWENTLTARAWLYQTPADILIKASNGASDFGNKFGQPLICGSLLTFEHRSDKVNYSYDKVIMQAGGVGYGIKKDALKDIPNVGDKIVILGGDNYRIGMGGGAVSSVETGAYKSSIELNAVQRSNPEMQKRAANTIRALSELSENPIVSIHDHGAGGHLNCLSELVEETGGTIDVSKLPIGDPTLSAKEIVGNESQERMGLIINNKDIPLLTAIANRERCPIYVVGETTNSQRFIFNGGNEDTNPIDLALEDMFGGPPQTIMRDTTVKSNLSPLNYETDKIESQIKNIFSLEAVASKDWLTNKVDRSVSGKVALQQTVGSLQLPLNNLGVMALDYLGESGVATALGHAPAVALISASAGSRMAIARSLTNIIWGSLTHQLSGISLSANWMWPCRVAGEDARLYEAVEATSDFAIALGINIPTGKDSLSMVQKYDKGEKVVSPGTVIITSASEVNDVKKTVTPNLKPIDGSQLLYVDISLSDFELGGSSFAQSLGQLGNACPDIKDPQYFAKCFNRIQDYIAKEQILAGHDIAAGGLITSLLEMNFSNTETGLGLNFDDFKNNSLENILFSENPTLLLQVSKDSKIQDELKSAGIQCYKIGTINLKREFNIKHNTSDLSLDIDRLRDVWAKPSNLLDQRQCEGDTANKRYANYKKQTLKWNLPKDFSAEKFSFDKCRQSTKVKAAIIREKGVNGDREMAWSLYQAGFNVKDVHMTDLITGREDLADIQFIVFVGGFSNSDVLGSAKGWAGAFKYNERAKNALEQFYKRKDTMSLGVCNGCQLMIALDLIKTKSSGEAKMLHNDSMKFESSFISVQIPKSTSIMLKPLEGSSLGIWIAHGEGKFALPQDTSAKNIALQYTYSDYPGNPNGSDQDCAGLTSDDGRHLAMMPHLERAIFPWQCADYPDHAKKEALTPWITAFIHAKDWLIKQLKANLA